MPRACDTTPLCQGATDTCWYVSTATFLWKARGALAALCGITLPEDISRFVQTVAETCALGGGVQCLNLPKDVMRAYMRKRESLGQSGSKPTLDSGGSANVLLATLLIKSGAATDIFNNPRAALDKLFDTSFPATRVFIVVRPVRYLGLPDKSLDGLSGPRMLIGMLAEARSCPKSVTLLGAFVRVKYKASRLAHVFAIVRCGTDNSFVICDSATGRCWDGASKTPFATKTKDPATFINVSFVYGRLVPAFVDAAAQ